MAKAAIISVVQQRQKQKRNTGILRSAQNDDVQDSKISVAKY
jgi:hypothetical protein